MARENLEKKLKMLDCFCGMGGVSDGFALEGFDITGIDIVDAPKMLGYKHRFIQADMLTLKGEDFRGYDVIWGSPPCRDFSQIGVLYGKKWKDPPNPEKGLELIKSFLSFIEKAKPKIWIMENVDRAKLYVPQKPNNMLTLQRKKRHCFWGNYPSFLMPRTNGVVRTRSSTGRDTAKGSFKQIGNKKMASWEAARIPLPCSRAFAKACKEKLENVKG